MQQTTICCGGWCFIYYYLCAIRCSTGFNSVLGPLFFLTYINHVSSLTLTDGSKLTMYADDILYKPIRQPEDYNGLQSDIDAIYCSNIVIYLELLLCMYACRILCMSTYRNLCRGHVLKWSR